MNRIVSVLTALTVAAGFCFIDATGPAQAFSAGKGRLTVSCESRPAMVCGADGNMVGHLLPSRSRGEKLTIQEGAGRTAVFQCEQGEWRREGATGQCGEWRREPWSACKDGKQTRNVTCYQPSNGAPDNPGSVDARACPADMPARERACSGVGEGAVNPAKARFCRIDVVRPRPTPLKVPWGTTNITEKVFHKFFRVTNPEMCRGIEITAANAATRNYKDPGRLHPESRVNKLIYEADDWTFNRDGSRDHRVIGSDRLDVTVSEIHGSRGKRATVNIWVKCTRDAQCLDDRLYCTRGGVCQPKASRGPR